MRVTEHIYNSENYSQVYMVNFLICVLESNNYNVLKPLKQALEFNTKIKSVL